MLLAALAFTFAECSLYSALTHDQVHLVSNGAYMWHLLSCAMINPMLMRSCFWLMTLIAESRLGWSGVVCSLGQARSLHVVYSLF